MNTYEDCSVEASNPVYHEKGRRWISVTNASSVDDSDAPALESQSTSPDLRNVGAVETNSLASRRPDASGPSGDDGDEKQIDGDGDEFDGGDSGSRRGTRRRVPTPPSRRRWCWAGCDELGFILLAMRRVGGTSDREPT